MIGVSEESVLVDQNNKIIKMKKKVRNVVAHVSLLFVKSSNSQFRRESTAEHTWSWSLICWKLDFPSWQYL